MNDPLAFPKNAHLTVYRVSNGEEKAVATDWLKDGVISIEAGEEEKKRLEYGVEDPLDGTRYQPDSGFLFMATLEQVYNTPYLYTSGVIEDHASE